MSLPASAKKKRVARALTTKGFQEEKNPPRGRKHRTFWYIHEGKTHKGIRTEIKKSDGNEIPRFLLKQMARQCRLPSADFRDFIDCDLTEGDYRRRVVNAVNTWPPRWRKDKLLPAS